MWTAALGFLPGATPNVIIGNGTGVQLNGLMQGQIITSNIVGVTGTGVLGGTSLDAFNEILNNTTPASPSPAKSDSIVSAAISHSIALQNGQVIDHNAFFDNNG